MKFLWTTIHVSDIERSLAFYRDLVGLPLRSRMSPNPDIDIAFLGDGPTAVELIRDGKAGSPRHGESVSMGFEVESLKMLAEELERRGLRVHAGPFQPNPRMRFVYVLDPDGFRVQFVENL